ncbi:MAG: hypothetical protein AAGI01_09160, partial [Myxococcota bacterium]
MSPTQRPLHTLFIITSLFAASATACLQSQVEVLCADVASERCSKCESCTRGVEGVAAGDLCSTNSESTERDCVDQLSNLCANQASVREDPNRELNLCLD